MSMSPFVIAFAAFGLFGAETFAAKGDLAAARPPEPEAALPPSALVQRRGLADVPRNPIDAKATWKPKGAFSVRRMAGDGRCMFRAIAAGAKHGADNTHAADDLRANVIRELRKRPDVEPFLEERFQGRFQAYVASMSRKTTWGGEVELIMASHWLRRPLWVWKTQSRGQSRGFTRIRAYGEEHGGEDAAIHLLFTVNPYDLNHYDLLLARQPSTKSVLSYGSMFKKKARARS
uniref:Ubiquitin thioesterase OTU n=1 Tax=Zooxanthella nutricula TaxID=1333877 RepID=A0A7S2LYY4_9DINO